MANKHKNMFHNSEYVIVKLCNEDTMALINDTSNSVIVVDLKLTHCFKPMYAVTVHKCQGMAIYQPYSIYEFKRMKHDMLYVCLTRTYKQQYVNLWDIKCVQPYTSYIYKYSYHNISYIGCTTDIDKRGEEHRDYKTIKCGRALKKYGYDNFKLKS